jgi:hypothetical protein
MEGLTDKAKSRFDGAGPGAVTSRSREDKEQSDGCGSVATILSIHKAAVRRS